MLVELARHAGVPGLQLGGWSLQSLLFQVEQLVRDLRAVVEELQTSGELGLLLEVLSCLVLPEELGDVGFCPLHLELRIESTLELLHKHAVERKFQ